jgi:asparagine synthase (glutamine-hydrolysing)
MSTYILCSQTERKNLNKYIDHYSSSGGYLTHDILIGDNSLLVFSDLQGAPPVFHKKNNDFVIALGCELKSSNKDFWLKFIDSHTPEIYPESITELTATLIVYKENTLFLYNDNLSCNKFYTNKKSNSLSNSFLALCHLEGKNLNINSESVYEYLINGSLFGTNTFFNEVNSIEHNHYVVVNNDYTIKDRTVELANTPSTKTKNNPSITELATHENSKLLTLLSNVNIDERAIVSFSGGYDSRLLLSLMRSLGYSPDLFVYGNDTSDDVAVAKNIAFKEKLNLNIIDKSTQNACYSLEESMKDFYAFDGWKVEHGIFDGGIDRKDRLMRNKDGRVSINGSLGEIYRNFYYMPKSSSSLNQLVHTFYSQYDPKAFTERFNELNYENSIEKKMQNAIGIQADTSTSRNDIEKLYPYFRGRFWAGRDARLNNNFGAALFPFMHESIVKDSSSIPLSIKEMGRMQSEMIKLLDINLASYQSDYGFNFVEKKPLPYKASYFISVHKPAWLRKYSQRLKNIKKQSIDIENHMKKFNEIIDSFSYMNKYVVIENIKDERVLGLVITLEFLFQHFCATDKP